MKVEREILVALEVQELKRRPDHNFYYRYAMAEVEGYTEEFEFAYKFARGVKATIEEALDVAYRFFLLHLHNFERGGVLDQFDFDWELKHYLEVGLKEPPEFPFDRDRKDYVNV